jgi:hypothetical protein
MELTLKIEDKYYKTFVSFLKTLDYVEVLENKTPQIVEEPKAKYGHKNKRPSADEIEQMIIKKAMLDAKRIERGELETRSFDSIEALIADLEKDQNDNDI